MSSPQFPVSFRSIAWALLTPNHLGPLVALDAHDRWQANNDELDLERDFTLVNSQHFSGQARPEQPGSAIRNGPKPS
jgi:hypothetical protein